MPTCLQFENHVSTGTDKVKLQFVKRFVAIFAASLVMFAFGSTASGGIATYFGTDLFPSATIPSGGNAQNARANFLAALTGGVGTEDFEGISPAQTEPYALAFPGSIGSITATLSGNDLDLRNSPSVGAFPTSGNQYLEATTATGTGEFEIDFSSPIAAFGFYGTDLGDAGGGNLRLMLTNGTTQNLEVPVAGFPSGNLLFYGFVSDTDTFTSIAFENTGGGGDVWGFDDMTIGDIGQVASPSVIPEPTSIAIFGIGVVLVGLRRRRNDRTASVIKRFPK